MMRCHCSGVTLPDAKSLPETLPKLESIRMAISFAGISNENTNAGRCSSTFMAMLVTTFIAKEVLPTPGRAAIIFKVPPRNPEVKLSRSLKPVATPCIFLLESMSALICFTNSKATAVICLGPESAERRDSDNS